MIQCAPEKQAPLQRTNKPALFLHLFVVGLLSAEREVRPEMLVSAPGWCFLTDRGPRACMGASMHGMKHIP